MILLDTHAFYWFICDDEKMPQQEDLIFVTVDSNIEKYDVKRFWGS